MNFPARERWLEAHAYLRPVADLCARVEEAAAGLERTHPGIPCWEDYRPEFLEGVPLLQSAQAPLDLGPAAAMVSALAARLASEPLTPALAAEARALGEQLRSEPGSPQRAVSWLLGDETFVPSAPGLLRYLGWTALTLYLRPVAEAFAAWRDEERWLRRYCPTCGSSPAMAQLVGVDAGRKRLLSCGRCGTRWQFNRTKCPFCEADTQRLASISVEQEPGLRIDYCASCRGYLKTYDGQGEEETMLSDWTTLHLDLVARDRGLERLAESLYELDREFPA